jgi:hypothetical protein
MVTEIFSLWHRKKAAESHVPAGIGFQGMEQRRRMLVLERASAANMRFTTSDGNDAIGSSGRALTARFA